jgi:hypothetical protein
VVTGLRAKIVVVIVSTVGLIIFTIVFLSQYATLLVGPFNSSILVAIVIAVTIICAALAFHRSQMIGDREI